MKNRIIFLLFSFLNILSANAEYFRNLSLQNGLSQPSVLSIAQDGLGRMWFGTQEGINMYDGEQITYVKGNITNIQGDSLWIGNYISFIVHDDEGNIFFIADNNLFGYNIFYSDYKQYTKGNVTTALAACRNEIWYTCNDSLFSYDCQKKQLQFVLRLPSHTVNTLTVSDTNIYVGMVDGLCIIPRKSLGLSHFMLSGIDK